jgi:hypothetical protein
MSKSKIVVMNVHEIMFATLTVLFALRDCEFTQIQCVCVSKVDKRDNA